MESPSGENDVAVLVTTNSDQSGSLIILERIVLALLEESKSFLPDLEQTDEFVARKLCKKHLQSMEVENPMREREVQTRSEAQENRKLPVEEIILCSHMILLFVSILHIVPCGEWKDQLVKNVQSLLPRCSWWMPRRILLAYLALQDEVQYSFPHFLFDC
jgi:hypothetical protein